MANEGMGATILKGPRKNTVCTCVWDNYPLYGSMCMGCRVYVFTLLGTILLQAFFDQLEEEGNNYYQQGMYHEALEKYMKALKYSSRQNTKEQIASIRANCTMACIKQQMYGEAYTHCMEWIKMDPKNHKVG